MCLFASSDFIFASQAFFVAHPEFAKNDLFVMGESYGSYYVPAVSARLHQANKLRQGLPINLKVRVFHACPQFFDGKCLGVLFIHLQIHLNVF